MSADHPGVKFRPAFNRKYYDSVVHLELRLWLAMNLKIYKLEREKKKSWTIEANIWRDVETFTLKQVSLWNNKILLMY